MNVIVGDDEFDKTERDPWIFYVSGRHRWILVTGDTAFMQSFPHMPAIALGNTTVIAFTNNNYNSDVRATAFKGALPAILRAVKKSAERFIGSVGSNGTFKILERSSTPKRKYCDEKDWESYRLVCATEGVEPEARKQEESTPLVVRVPPQS